jgi:hypothetical protein
LVENGAAGGGKISHDGIAVGFGGRESRWKSEEYCSPEYYAGNAQKIMGCFPTRGPDVSHFTP